MHQDIVLAERTAVGPPKAPASPPTLVCIRRELETARKLLNNLSFAAYDRLDQTEMYDLGAAEGLVAGALKKLDAAVAS